MSTVSNVSFSYVYMVGLDQYVGLCNYKCKGVIHPFFYLLMIYQDKYLSLFNQK
jgi:hypothetical protein